MRARLLVETLLVQMLLAISIGDVWAACVNPPMSAQSISQFRSNPHAFVAPDSDTQTKSNPHAFAPPQPNTHTTQSYPRKPLVTHPPPAADLFSIARETT